MTTGRRLTHQRLATWQITTFSEIDSYQYAMAYDRIRCTARKGTRQLNTSFYGIGCPHPAVECLVAQLNKLIMHYGSKSCLGLNLQISLELMIIEMGMTLQPLAENYNQCHHWVTP